MQTKRHSNHYWNVMGFLWFYSGDHWVICLRFDPGAWWIGCRITRSYLPYYSASVAMQLVPMLEFEISRTKENTP